MGGARSTRLLTLACVFAVIALAGALPAAAQQEPAQEPTAEEPSGSPDEPAGTSTDGSEDGSAPAEPQDEPRSTTAARRNSGRREYASRHLSLGDRGRDVRVLQRLLTKLNFRTRVDGRFGKGTQRSVKRYELWQRKRHPNGAISQQGQRKLRDLVRDGKRYRNHVFPVRGPHDYGGSGSRFGAPRSGHTHQGQDVAAAQGTPLAAVHEGRVSTRQYQAGGAGYYVVIRGRDGRDSVYMHLMKRARVRPGQKVMAGQRIGFVGTTGSSTGPHLHFELWTPHWYAGGHAYDPLRLLKRWDRRT